MKRFVHGTSYESAMDIIKNGFKEDKPTIWTCSRKDMLYLREESGEDKETEWMTIETGQIAAAYNNSKDTRIAIIRFEMSDELASKIIEDDNSCDISYSYQVLISNLNEGLKKHTITATVDIYADAYVPYMRPFYLANLDKTYLQIKDKLLEKATQIAKDASVYIEEIFDYGEICEQYKLENS